MNLKISIWDSDLPKKLSINYCMIEKEMNDNFADTIINIDNFLGKKISIKAEKFSYIEETDTIICQGVLWSHSAAMLKMYGTTRLHGIDLKALGLKLEQLYENQKELKEAGFKVVFGNDNIESLLNQAKHDRKRTRIQKLFGLNKYKFSKVFGQKYKKAA